MDLENRSPEQSRALLRLTTLLIIALWTIPAHISRAQGGPPMITDDPGTPGSGHWENNLALTFERRPHEISFDAPGIDLNYGLGERIQLTLQTSVVLLKRSGQGVIGGLGGTEAAVKWRFLDEERSGFDMSMFPRMIFNVSQSSPRRGLSEDGTRFQLPFQLAKKFGAIDMDFEFGALVSTVGRGEFLYGIVGGTEVTKTTSIMAELHGTSRTNFARDTLILNFGFRHNISEHATWIASLGHELRSPEDEPLAFIGYCGVQLLY